MRTSLAVVLLAVLTPLVGCASLSAGTYQDAVSRWRLGDHKGAVVQAQKMYETIRDDNGGNQYVVGNRGKQLEIGAVVNDDDLLPDLDVVGYQILVVELLDRRRGEPVDRQGSGAGVSEIGVEADNEPVIISRKRLRGGEHVGICAAR